MDAGDVGWVDGDACSRGIVVSVRLPDGKDANLYDIAYLCYYINGVYSPVT